MAPPEPRLNELHEEGWETYALRESETVDRPATRFLHTRSGKKKSPQERIRRALKEKKVTTNQMLKQARDSVTGTERRIRDLSILNIVFLYLRENRLSVKSVPKISKESKYGGLGTGASFNLVFLNDAVVEFDLVTG